MGHRFASVFSSKHAIRDKLENMLAGGASTVAKNIVEETQRDVENAWLSKQQLWLQRCEDAISSIQKTALEIERGDVSGLVPAMQPAKRVQTDVAWMLCMLSDAGFSHEEFGPVLADARAVLEDAHVPMQPLHLQLPQLPQLPDPAVPGRRPQDTAARAAVLPRCKICGVTLHGCRMFANVALGPATYAALATVAEAGLVAAVKAHFMPPSVVCRNCQDHARTRVRAHPATTITFDSFNGIIDAVFAVRLRHVRAITGAEPPQPEHVAKPPPPPPPPPPAPPAHKRKRNDLRKSKVPRKSKDPRRSD